MAVLAKLFTNQINKQESINVLTTCKRCSSNLASTTNKKETFSRNTTTYAYYMQGVKNFLKVYTLK